MTDGNELGLRQRMRLTFPPGTIHTHNPFLAITPAYCAMTGTFSRPSGRARAAQKGQARFEISFSSSHSSRNISGVFLGLQPSSIGSLSSSNIAFTYAIGML